MRIFIVLILCVGFSRANPLFTKNGTMLYKVYVTAVPVAEIKVKNQGVEKVQGRDAHHLHLFLKANAPLRFIYNIKDEFDVWVDTQTLLPLKETRNIHEGKTRRKTEMNFDYKKGVVHVERKFDKKTFTMKLQKNPYELAGFFYYLKKETFSLSRDAEFYYTDIFKRHYTLMNLAVKKTPPLTFTVKDVNGKPKDFSTLSIEQKSGLGIQINVSDDPENILLRIAFRLYRIPGYGTIDIKARLISMEY